MRILLDPVIASPILIFGGRQLRDILLCKIWVSNKGVHVPRVSAWWSPTLIIWFWKFLNILEKKVKVSENTHQHTYTSTWIWETGKKEIKCTQRWWRAIHNSLCNHASKPTKCYALSMCSDFPLQRSGQLRIILTFWPIMLCSEQLRALKLLSSYEKKYNETPLEVPTLFNFHLNCTTTSQGDSCLMSHNSGSTHEEGVGCICWQQFEHLASERNITVFFKYKSA